MTQRKPPAKRLFVGGAGSALSYVDDTVQAQRSEPVVVLESAESSSSSPKSTKFLSMRTTLMLEPEDLIALFDESRATQVGERVVFEQVDFVIPTAMLEHRIERLKKIITRSKAVIEGLAVNVMKIRRGTDNVLDKPTREKFKREENARLARCNAKLSRYRTALRVGNHQEKIWRVQTRAVYFRDVIEDYLMFKNPVGEWHYENDLERRVGGIVTHHTTNLVQNITSGIYDIERYEVVMRLDQNSLELLGEFANDHKISWRNWTRWENSIIKAAVFHGVLRPRPDLLEMLSLMPFVRHAINAVDENEIEADRTEDALAIKTGGACYGGRIRGAGFDYRGRTPRRRSLTSFDKAIPERGMHVGGGSDNGFGDLKDVNDDVESYVPE